MTLSAMALWLSKQNVMHKICGFMSLILTALELHFSQLVSVVLKDIGKNILIIYLYSFSLYPGSWRHHIKLYIHDDGSYELYPWWQIIWIITTGLSFVKMLFCTRVVLFTWITTVIRQFANEKVKNLYFDFYCQKLSFNIFRFYLNCMKFSLQFKLQKWLFHWILNGLNHFKPLVELNLGWAKLIWYC